jgi:uncharacterized membrane protein (DUF373 family)
LVTDKLKHAIEQTEKGILWVLAFMLLIAVAFGMIHLVVDLFVALKTPPLMMIKSDTLFGMFGEFLIILMGLKLIKLVMISMPGESSPITAVIEVALIGVGQKIVTMDIHTQSPASMMGAASLVVALSIAYVCCQRFGGMLAKDQADDPLSVTTMSDGPAQ